MVHALQKGKISPSSVSEKIRSAAKSIDPGDARDFAATGTSGLPENMKKESGWISNAGIGAITGGGISAVSNIKNYLSYRKKLSNSQRIEMIKGMIMETMKDAGIGSTIGFAATPILDNYISSVPYDPRLRGQASSSSPYR